MFVLFKQLVLFTWTLRQVLHQNNLVQKGRQKWKHYTANTPLSLCLLKHHFNSTMTNTVIWDSPSSGRVFLWCFDLIRTFYALSIYALLDSILLLKLVKTCFLFPFPFPQKKYPLSRLQKYYLVNEVVYRPRQMHKIINPGDVRTSKVLERIYRSVDFQ